MACNCTSSILSNCSNQDLINLAGIITSLGCGPIGTNLTYMPAPTNGTILSSTGTPAFVPLANAINSGLLPPDLYTKLVNMTPGGASTLDELTDVVILSPVDTEVLTYEGGLWKNKPSAGGANYWTLGAGGIITNNNVGEVVIDTSVGDSAPSTIPILRSDNFLTIGGGVGFGVSKSGNISGSYIYGTVFAAPSNTGGFTNNEGSITFGSRYDAGGNRWVSNSRLKYTTDLMSGADFDARTLVDKGYVDTFISNSNYWTKTGNDIQNNNTGMVFIGVAANCSGANVKLCLGGFTKLGYEGIGAGDGSWIIDRDSAGNGGAMRFRAQGYGAGNPYAYRFLDVSSVPYLELRTDGTSYLYETLNIRTGRPVNLVATPSTTGGTLPASSYNYRVTAVNGIGETVASAAASAVTTGSTGSVSLTWMAMPGAASYRVYRGLVSPTMYSASTNSFIDTNAAGISASPPGTDIPPGVILRSDGAGTFGSLVKYTTDLSASYDVRTLVDKGYVDRVQITITTSVSISTATLSTDLPAISQHGKNVIIDNGASNINFTCDGGITASYLKHGTGNIAFIQGSGRTLVLVDGASILNGALGSTATLTSVGLIDYLRMSNA